MFNLNSNDSVILPDGETLKYNIKKTRRQSVGLKISTNGLTVHAPIFISKYKIKQLILKKSQWIISKLKSISPKFPKFKIVNNSCFKLFDNEVIISTLIGHEKNIMIKDGICFFTFKEDDNAKQKKDFFLKWIKCYALEEFNKRINFYCKKYNFFVNKVYLSNAKTRWGTCNSKKEVRLNWRLIQASSTVIDYVICHELCHLKYMDHSINFWNLVENVYPDYKEAESYLKKQGINLYRLD